jgi:hypothetical protein
MTSLLHTLNLFNADGSDGTIKFYEYAANGTYSTETSKILFNNNGDVALDAKAGSSINMISGGAGSLTFVHSNSGDWGIKNLITNKDIIFNVLDGSTDTEVMRIVGATSRIGIGKASPSTKLDVNGTVKATAFTGPLTGAVTGNADTATTATNATNITVADESSDTSCNVVFTTAATGNLPPKTGTNLTFNSSSGILTATGFSGDLTGAVAGNADTATTATNVTSTANNSSNETVYLTFIDGATGAQGIETDTGLTYNPFTGVLTTTSVSASNIGIGTTGPDRKLDILDNSNPQLRLTHTDGTRYIDFKTVANSSVSSLEISTPDTNGFIRFNDGGNVSSFISAGNSDTIPFFAIGNTSGGSIATTPSDIGNGFKFLYRSTDGNFRMQRNNGNASSNDVLTILRSNGNVGIGTTTPFHKLEVNGTIKATGSFTDGILSIYHGSITEVKTIQATNGSFTNLYGNASTATTATNATNITVADESSDTSCNVVFTTAATGNLPPKTGTNLTFNSSSGILTATGFSGDLTGAVTGNADTATTATNVTSTANNSSNETVYLTFIDGATGAQGIETDTGLTYNPFTGVLTTTSVSGNLTGAVSGNADSATTATNATNITVADESSDTSCNVVFTTAATGNLPPKTGTNLTFNSSTGELSTTSLAIGTKARFTDDGTYSHIYYNGQDMMSWTDSVFNFNKTIYIAGNTLIFGGDSNDGKIHWQEAASGGIDADSLVIKAGDQGDSSNGSIYLQSNNSGAAKTEVHIDGTNNKVKFYGTGYFSGNLGIGTTSPVGPLHIKQSGDDGGDNLNQESYAAIIIERSSSNTNRWYIGHNSNNDLQFWYNSSDMGYLTTSNVGQIDFTGQHRCFYNDYSINTLKNMEGLIVSANKNSYTSMSGSLTKGLSAITINESLPDISLCIKEKDKAVFGVISTTEDPDKRENVFGNFVSVSDKETGDTRPYINSVGEGAIWVSNKNNNLESGDYITSATIPGYGMKQDDDLLHNYTVAKITMDCNFAPQTVPNKIILKDSNGDNILDSNGYIQFVDHSSETELQYNIRYLQSDGTIITESDYNTKLGNGESVYKAAFVGCTYHCG